VVREVFDTREQRGASRDQIIAAVGHRTNIPSRYRLAISLRIFNSTKLQRKNCVLRCCLYYTRHPRELECPDTQQGCSLGDRRRALGRLWACAMEFFVGHARGQLEL
jgi:hypothetical protein